MYELLVISPAGEQMVITVDEGGGYYDDNRVLWDVRKDGVMPQVTLGKMQRVGGQLITQDDFTPEHAAAVYKKLVPEQVLMTAAREALIDAGLLWAVNTYMQTLSEKDQVWWDYSVSISRKFPLVESARIALGMTSEQIDQLFIAAGEIEKQRAVNL